MFMCVPQVLCLLLHFMVFKATTALEWRVLEGKELQYDVHSYLVNLEIRSKTEVGVKVCSGSIISSSWIVTAAHCINSDLHSVRVLQSTKDGTTLIAKVNTQNVFPHPRFVPNDKTNTNKENDIALLQLKAAIAFDSNINPMELSERRPKIGQTATIAGYGLAEDDVDPPREGAVIISMCPNDIVNCICTRDSIRAGPGDSGGPLIYKGALAGVISSGCMNVLVNRICLTVYSSIALHSDWIKHVTENTVKWIK